MGQPDPDNATRRSTDLHVEATYRLTEALVAAEERTRRRINLLSEVVFETNAAGEIVFLNRAWQAATGHPCEACLQQPLSRYFHPQDRPLWERVLADPPRHPTTWTPSLRLLRPDGAPAWMELSLAWIPEGGVVGALRDITHQKQTQDELVKLSLVASFTHNLVVITDRHGRTEWVNRAFIERTGYTLEDMRGRKPGEVLQGPDTDRTTVARVAAWLKEGRPFSTELLNYTKAGEAYWVSVNVTPIRNGGGFIERFISVQTDSTALHQAQAELEAAKSRAEAANEAKSRFLATISHEMRTPLNAVIGSSELSLVDRDDPSALQGHLLRIRDSGDQLLRLINDILDVSKIEAGQIDIEPSRVRLRSLLEETLAPIASRARAKGLSLAFHWEESLPAEVISDRDRLRQILINLVENAVKFTDVGEIRVEVRRLPVSGGEAPFLELAVCDTGVGITPEAQARIFDPFEQGDSSTTRRKSGVGLGLNIVRSIVLAMGGTVHIDSRPGAGTALRVLLPLVPAEPTGAAASTQERRSPASRSQSGCHILVAEDSNVNYAVLQAMLRKGGYTLERAHDGQEAVAAATRCDLVLMDLEMPRMDGLEATRRIRAEERERHSRPVPVIALTAHALKEYQERCLAAGCTGYLTKPIRMAELLEAVGTALQCPGETG